MQLGLQIFNRKATGLEFGTLCRGVDFDQQLALFDFSTDFDMDFVDLPGGLRTHIDILPGLQGAQGGHAAFNVAAGNRHGVIGFATQGQK